MALGSENQISYILQQPSKQVSLGRSIMQHHTRQIAPAPTQRTCGTPYSKPVKSYAGTTLDSNNPSVVRRNARERNRVKQVNNGFSHLRQHIPVAIVADLSNGRRGIGPGASKKLSKVDTLRMAVEYIRRLQQVIEEVDRSDTSSISSYNSCGSSTSGSPPPASTSMTGSTNFFGHQPFHTTSYASSFQQQQNSVLVSPTASIGSSACSSELYYQSEIQQNFTSSNEEGLINIKFEQPFDEYSSPSADDDEELLDYISLWQENM